MKIKPAYIALIPLTVIGCAATGKIQKTDLRYAKVAECAGNILAFIVADTSLDFRISNNIRHGEFEMEMIKESVNRHPSSEAAKTVFYDLGFSNVKDAVDSIRPSVEQELADANKKHDGDRIEALKDVMQKLNSTVMTSCSRAGYPPSSIQRISQLTYDAKRRKDQELRDQEIAHRLEQEQKAKQKEEIDRRKTETKNKARALIRKATGQERLSIIKSINKTLLDSEFAKYKDIYLIKNSYACAQVNAKNRFGGYVGFQDYIVAFLNNEWHSIGNLGSLPVHCFDAIAELHTKKVN